MMNSPTDFKAMYENFFSMAEKDPDLLEKLKVDPIPVLKKEVGGGANLPAEMTEMLEKLIAGVIQVRKNTVDGVCRFENTMVNEGYISFGVNWAGLVWTLSEQATQDAISGSGDLVSAMMSLAASAAEEAVLSIIAVAMAIYLAASAGILYLVDATYHKGVYLTVPWISIPFGVTIIPTPVV